MTAAPAPVAWYKRMWVHALLLVFIPYVQMPLMWWLGLFSLRTRIAATVFGCWLMVAFLIHDGTDRKPSADGHAQPSSTSAMQVPDRQEAEEAISWQQINRIYSLDSNSTDLQKKQAWKRFKGKRVSWQGSVSEVSDGFGGLTLQVKMNPDTLTSDVLVSLRKSERAKAASLQQGSYVRFSGVLDNWGTIMPITLDDGEIR